MRADLCSASGRVLGRYPGRDVMSGMDIATPQTISADPAEEECLRLCLEEVSGCNSAVLVTSESGTEKTCYFKAARVEARTEFVRQRFVLLGCEGGAPPGELPLTLLTLNLESQITPLCCAASVAVVQLCVPPHVHTPLAVTTDSETRCMVVKGAAAEDGADQCLHQGVFIKVSCVLFTTAHRRAPAMMLPKMSNMTDCALSAAGSQARACTQGQSRAPVSSPGSVEGSTQGD